MKMKMKYTMINKIKTKVFYTYYRYRYNIKQLIQFSIFGKFWISYYFLIPILIPVFFFGSVLNLKTDLPFLVYFFSGLLAYSISFSAFKFSIRSLFIFRNVYERSINLPLENFYNYFNLNFIFLAINLFFLFCSIIFYSLDLSGVNYLLIFISLVNAYYFGKFLTLLASYLNITFRDSKIIARNLSTFFFIFSPIAYSIENLDNIFIKILFTINPISQSCFGIRNSLFNMDFPLTNLNYFFGISFILLYYILRNYIKKNIYKIYSITN